MKIINDYTKTTYQYLSIINNNNTYNLKFCASMPHMAKSQGIARSFIDKIKTIISSNEQQILSESEKFINIRDKLLKKYEPVFIQLNKAIWNYNTNFNIINKLIMKILQVKLYVIGKNKSEYKKLLNIDRTKLLDSEIKQLKYILMQFNEVQNNCKLKNTIDSKQIKILHDYSAYIPKIDGQQINIANILQNETNTAIRKKAYYAYIRSGDLIADDLLELIKMRNKYAKLRGYDNYYDYKLKETYNVEPEYIDKLIDDVYSRLQPKIKEIQEKNETELKDLFCIDKLENYHYRLLLNSNPEKAINKFLINNNILDIVKVIYSGMGYDIDKFQKEGKLTLDLSVKKCKTKHSMCSSINHCNDVRISINLVNNIQSFYSLVHELGHSMYDFGISKELNLIDRKPSSVALTEAIAMMMESVAIKENFFKNIIPNELLGKFREFLNNKDFEFLLKCKTIIEFEREIYKNPEQDPQKLWAYIKGKNYNIKVEPNNEWATIPHYITSPAYYQNYFRAILMKEQIYNHLHKVLGNITENPKTFEYLNKNIFKFGATINDNDLIMQLTGKELSADNFVCGLI